MSTLNSHHVRRWSGRVVRTDQCEGEHGGRDEQGERRRVLARHLRRRLDDVEQNHEDLHDPQNLRTTRVHLVQFS